MSSGAAAFLETLFADDPGWIEFRIIADHPSAPPPDQRWYRSTADAIADLDRVIGGAVHRGDAVFFGVLPRTSRGDGSAAGAAPGWVAWCDLDFKDQVEPEYRRRVAHLQHQPSIVVRSGRGLHLYWLMTEPTDPRVLSEIGRRITLALGGDHCFDAARILRMPGSRNCKDNWSLSGGEWTYTRGDGPTCTIEDSHPERRYNVSDFDDLPEPVLSEKIEAPIRPRATKEIASTLSDRVQRLLRRPRIADLWASRGKQPPGDCSESGYDWSLALALAWAGVSDVNELDAAIAARPTTSTRTLRDARRCSDRALAVIETRLAVPVDAPETPATDPLTQLAAAAPRIAAAQAPGGDVADLRRLEIELSAPPFLSAVANLPDPNAALLALSLLAVHGFKQQVRRIDKVVSKAIGVVAEARARAERGDAIREAAEVATREEWPLTRRGPHPAIRSALAIGRDGPKPCFSNIFKIIRDDPRWGPRFRVNRMGEIVEMDGVPIESEPLTVARLTEWISDTYRIQVATDIVRGALYAAAEIKAYHPVRDWFAALPAWDGVPRMALLVREVLGLEYAPTEEGAALAALHETFLRRTMIGAVARVMTPGCKVDTALIFVGKQGAKKSSFFHDLFGHGWFGDSPIPIGDKNAAIQLRAAWGYECAELESLSRKTAEEVKQFMAIASDLFRHIYEKNARYWPRHSVIVGSTNRREFLTDPTGSRRFWPIEIADARVINLSRLREIRETLWREAYAAWAAAAASIAAHELPAPAHRWWFEADEDIAREEYARAFEDRDVWYPLVVEWVATANNFTTANALVEAVKMPKDRMGTAEKRRMGAILRALGLEAKSQREAGRTSDVWRKPETPPTKPPPGVAPEPRTDPKAETYLERMVPEDDDGIPY